MSEIVFIIKDKIAKILKEHSISFANINWKLTKTDVIDIFEHEEDMWNNIKPVYSIKLADVKYENPEFNRTYEKFLLYKPDADISKEVHIAFILHKNSILDNISVEVTYR